MTDRAIQPAENDAAKSRPPDMFAPIEPAAAYPPRYWWLKRIGLACALLLLGLVGLRVWWGAYAERKLQAKLDELRAAGAPVTIDDLRHAPVPAEQNAAVLLRRAAYSLTAGWPESVSEHAAPSLLRLYMDEIEVNAEAIMLVRAVRDCPDVDWQIKWASPMISTTAIPDLSAQRNLARFFAFAASASHQAGDDQASIEFIRDILEIARGMDQLQWGVIGPLVADVIDGLAIERIESIAPSLQTVGDPNTTPATCDQVLSLIDRLLDDEQIDQGWRGSMAIERLEMIDLFDDLVDDPLMWYALVAGGTAPAGKLGGRVASLLVGPMIKLDSLAAVQHISGIADVGLVEPYNRATAYVPLIPPDQNGFERIAHLFSRLAVPSIARGVDLKFRRAAMRRMAAVALALRLFEIEHGSRPGSLSDLTPTYLPGVPADPYASDGRPISYVPDGAHPRLYCVNLDGTDDGGVVAIREAGWTDWDERDLVFSLDGSSPTDWRDTPATQPASSQAEID